jgi:hypothetical protein
MELTFTRSLKIWWSFIWRYFILSVPSAILLSIVVFALGLIPQRGESLSEGGGAFTLITVFSLICMITLQAMALKWTLKTRWSDFSLTVSPNSENIIS